MPHRSRLAALILSAAAVLAACSGSDAAPDPTTTPPTTSAATSAPAPTTTATGTTVTISPNGATEAPAGNAFYQPPTPLPGATHGDLIWSRPITRLPAGIVGWQVLYRSENIAGEAIAVSGVVFAPAGAPAGSPVLSWAHGTAGLGDSCAPSKDYAAGTSFELALVQVAVSNGWSFMATDYEGLGTPGVHPFLVGSSSGRGVLDIVRAARQLPGSGAGTDSPVMLLGHSQGGGAALFAAQEAASYAPDLRVVGTAAGAPPGELTAIVPATFNSNSAAGYGLMMVEGLRAAYPDLPLASVVNGAGAAVLDQVGAQCSDATFALGNQATTIAASDPMLDPRWKAAIEANTAGNVKPSAPVLIFHGEADTTVPRSLTDLTLARYCAVGATVQVKSYPGQDHLGVVFAALGDITAFLAARLAGSPATSSC